MANQVGVYMVKHKDGHFYIGSSKELTQRWAIHRSRLKAGNNNNKLQQHFNKTGKNIDDWTFEIVQTCREKSLQKLEEQLIKKHWGSPQMLNVRKDGVTGKRGIKTSTTARHKIANELLGKNTKDGKIHRPANLTFISPDGTEYANIQSVKRFAKEQGLAQSSLCQLSNGNVAVVEGWIVKNGEMPDIGRIVDLWSYERLKKHFKEYHILSPDNKLYKTFYVYGLEEEHDCSVILADQRDRWPSKSMKGLNDNGQGWREIGAATYRIVWNGVTYENILCVPKWCDTHGVRLDRMRSYLTTPLKYTRKFSIELE
jgi:group I intron endonuclease